MPDDHRVLLLGGASVGKTTLLTQLYGRLQGGDGQLRMRRAPASLAPIQAALRRLEQGLMVEHTPHTTNVEQILHATTIAGEAVDVVLPDYAGETLADVVQRRHAPSAWQRRVRDADHLILLLRLSQHSAPPDIISRPVANIQTDGAPGMAASSALGPSLDLWTVELLQIILHIRRSNGDGPRSLPRLTIVLSCWDELRLPDRTVPAQVVKERVPMVADFCIAHWGRCATTIGLSAQGQNLRKDEEETKFVDLGPQEMGWLVLPDGDHDTDLTRLLTDL